MMSRFISENASWLPFDGAVFGQNNMADEVGSQRQPSYLMAVGVTHPVPATGLLSENFQPARPVRNFGSTCTVEAQRYNNGSIERHSQDSLYKCQVPNLCDSSSNPYQENSHLPPVHTSTRYQTLEKRRECLGGEGRSAGDLVTKSCTSYAQNANVPLFQEPKFLVKEYPAVLGQGHPEFGYNKLRNIPRAVIAPMSRIDSDNHSLLTDRVSSLSKSVKNQTHLDKANPLPDRNAALNNHTDNHTEVYSFKPSGISLPEVSKIQVDRETRVIYGKTDLKGKIFEEMTYGSNHGVLAPYHMQSNANHSRPSVEKSLKFLGPQSRDEYEEERFYIDPQQVEKVLNLQKSRKPSATGSKLSGIHKVVSQGVASLEFLGQADRKTAECRSMITPNAYSELTDGLMKTYSGTPVEKALEVDQRSVSSTSTSHSSITSQRDSGYSGDRYSDAATSRSHSPEILNLHSSPLYVRQTSGILASHSSGNDLNQAVNHLIQSSSKITHRATQKTGDGLRSGVVAEGATERTKYLDMLKKQIELYRVKDEESLKLEKVSSSLGEASFISDLEVGRNAVASSCFELDKLTGNDNFPFSADKARIAHNHAGISHDHAGISRDHAGISAGISWNGSMDLSKCQLRQAGNFDSLKHLMSKKKASKLKQVDKGAYDKGRSDPGVHLVNDFVKRQNSDSEVQTVNQYQNPRVNKLIQKPESVRSDDGCENRGENVPCFNSGSENDGMELASEFSHMNSAEDIVNTWLMMKTARKSEDQAKETSFHADCPRNKSGNPAKKSVSFSDSVALIASSEDAPNTKVDYVEYVTSFLRKRTKDLRSFEATDDHNSQSETSSHGSLSSRSRSDSSGSRSNSNVSVPESSSSSNSREGDSDFYENDESSENDSVETTVDETGRIRCSLCHKRWIDVSETYCRDCCFYLSRFQ